MRGKKRADSDYIDWLDVEFVCQGTTITGLTSLEQRMVVRRVRHRMRTLDDWWNSPATPTKLTAETLAQRMGTSERQIQRICADLPAGDRRRCPVCNQDMWLLTDGVVERHPDGLMRDCRMSGQLLHGLAAARPDLYLWAVTA